VDTKMDRKEIYSDQEIKEIFKQANSKYPTRKVIAILPSDTYSIDLVDMGEYKINQYRYILTCIDIFTRYAWAIPLKTKTADKVLEAIKKITPFPRMYWADQGKEFINKKFEEFMKENKIGIYHTYGNSKAVMVERLNRSLRDIMWPLLTQRNSVDWVSILPEVVSIYNNRKHTALKDVKGKLLTPQQVQNNPKLVKVEIEWNRPKSISAKPKYKKGDHVRVMIYKNKLNDKGAHARWSFEVYEIVKPTWYNPVMYKLKDVNGEILEGSFYEKELQLTKAPLGA
jgi:hypothetical protein